MLLPQPLQLAYDGQILGLPSVLQFQQLLQVGALHGLLAAPPTTSLSSRTENLENESLSFERFITKRLHFGAHV